MKQATRVQLDFEQANRIAETWARFAGALGKLNVSEDSVAKRGDRLFVRVTPENYPSNMFTLFGALADTEIELREQGFDVDLVPVIQQRFVVVAEVPGRGEYLFLSRDGDEFEDLARLLQLPAQPNLTSIEGYAYDNQDDLAHALTEARREHPAAKELGSLEMPQATA